MEITAEQRKAQERPRVESAPSYKTPAVDAVKAEGEQGTLSTKKQRGFTSRLLFCWTPNNVRTHSTLLIIHEEIRLSKCDQNNNNKKQTNANRTEFLPRGKGK